MTIPKEKNKSTVINPKEMETYKLPDKEFKITILMKLNELQESTVRRQDKIRKIIHEQNENINEELQTIKKY